MATGANQKSRSFLPLALIVLLVNFLTMPREFYAGDSHAIRMSSLQLIKNARFGIQEEKAPTLGTMTETEGKYFFHNSDKHKYFSKYGMFNTILFAPPLVAEDILHGVENFYDYERPTASHNLPFYTGSLVFMLNLYNIALSLLIAWYFYQIAGLYVARALTRSLFVLSIFYATFLWNYLRAQSAEIFQVLFFAGFFYHFIQFIRSDRKAWKQLLAATLFAGVLALTKQYYFLLFPVAAGFAVAAGARGRNLLAYMAGPMACFVIAAMAMNEWQFGSPFEAGYSQWQNPEGGPHDSFSLRHIPAALNGFFLEPNRALGVHFPPLLIALFGMPYFYRRHRLEFALVCGTFLIFLAVISTFQNWHGNWCYGPRYLLFILPALSLPLLHVIERLREKIRTPAGAAGAALCALLLLYSAKLQINVNSLPFFAVYELSHHYGQFKIPEDDAYFGHSNVGWICGDLLASRQGSAPFFPFEVLKQKGSAGDRKKIEWLDQLQKSDFFAPNYFFWPQRP